MQDLFQSPNLGVPKHLIHNRRTFVCVQFTAFLLIVCCSNPFLKRQDRDRRDWSLLIFRISKW
jgi:hypothetical protein